MEKSTVSVKKYQQYRDLFPACPDGRRRPAPGRAAPLANHLEEAALTNDFRLSTSGFGRCFSFRCSPFSSPARSSAGRSGFSTSSPRASSRNWPGTVNRARRIFRFVLLLLVLALVIVSLARPRWGYAFDEVKRKGLDLLLAVDVSRSMLSNDVQPNRLERVKLATQDLINELQGDRVGLIAFAGRAFLQAPLTIDYDAAVDSINDLDTKSIPEGGTNISDGDRARHPHLWQSRDRQSRADHFHRRRRTERRRGDRRRKPRPTRACASSPSASAHRAARSFRSRAKMAGPRL